MLSPRWLPIVVLTMTGCDHASSTTSPPTSVSAQQFAAAVSAPAPAASAKLGAQGGKRPMTAGEGVEGITVSTAREVLHKQGWKDAHAVITTPNFGLKGEGPDGNEANVEVVGQPDPEIRRYNVRPAVENAVWSEKGDILVAARVTSKTGEVDVAASERLLHALLARGSNPKDAITLIDGVATSAWLRPRIRPVGTNRKVDPALVARAVQELKRRGFEQSAVDMEQWIDTTKTNPVGVCKVVVADKQKYLTLVASCTEGGIKPKPSDADVGAAVFIDDACIVWLGVRPAEDELCDPVLSEKLLRELLGVSR